MANVGSGSRVEGGSETLRLLVYLALAVAMMVSDHRDGWLARARQVAAVGVEPVWWLASVPGRVAATVRGAVANQTRLNRENTALQQQLLLQGARIERLQLLRDENRQLRALLGGTRALQVSVQLAGILDIDLDPERQRVVLDIGANQGVHVGQVLIDAGGVLGQVISVTPTRATALLITDPAHAVPVQALRSGLRLIAFGTGRSDALSVPNVPRSGDLRVGDMLITSGIGGRFPAGFPVGRVETLQPDANHEFIVATLKPSARLDRSGQVLLVWNLPDDGGAEGPPAPSTPAPADLAARRAAAAAAVLKADAASATHVSPPPASAAPPAPAQPPVETQR
jgi:rod shape-determining protein MreC